MYHPQEEQNKTIQVAEEQQKCWNLFSSQRMFCSHSPTCATFSFSNLSVENWIHKRYTEQRNYIKYLGRHRPFHKKVAFQLDKLSVVSRLTIFFCVELTGTSKKLPISARRWLSPPCCSVVLSWTLAKVSQEQRKGAILCSPFKRKCYWRSADTATILYKQLQGSLLPWL